MNTGRQGIPSTARIEPSRAQPVLEVDPTTTSDSAQSNFVKTEILLTEQDLAKRWQCTTKKLQADRLKGAGVSHVKLGRLVRYRLSDVVQYERRNVRTSTSEGANS